MFFNHARSSLTKHAYEYPKKNVGNWKCRSCSEFFKNAQLLLEHFGKNHDEGIYGCVQCKYTSDFQMNVLNHFSSKHLEKLEQNQHNLLQNQSKKKKTVKTNRANHLEKNFGNGSENTANFSTFDNCNQYSTQNTIPSKSYNYSN